MDCYICSNSMEMQYKLLITATAINFLIVSFIYIMMLKKNTKTKILNIK